MRLRATLDSNILVYSELEPDSDKGSRSSALIRAAAPTGVLAVQALLEFMAVVRRRRPDRLGSARAKLELWSRIFEIAPTTTRVAASALELARAHNLQIWDAVIWSAARDAGAVLFLSEDLQDGFSMQGMRAMNPLRMSADDFGALLAD